MDITRFAIERSRIFGVALVIVMVSGAFAFREMPRSEDPGFVVRTALVRTMYPGASPERIEMLITDPLEKVIQEIPELDHISSQSKTGVSLIFVNIREDHSDMRPVWDNLRRKVERAAGELPDGIIGPAVNDEFGDVFGTIISITGDGFSYRDLKDVADEVRNELLLVEQTAKVEIIGAQEERIFVVFDNTRLAELGISPVQLQQGLVARNIILPGGDISTPYERIVLEPSGSFESVEDLAGTVIAIPGSDDMVRLGDVLEVQRSYIDPPHSRMRLNGEPSLALAVSLKEGGNIITLGQDVLKVLDRARRVYPVGIDFETLQFQASDVERKIQSFSHNLIQAVAIVAGVMLVFLGLRTGFIVASLIPATMLAAFLVMSMLEIGLDQISIASLIIALGMLVDNAIVMSESIMVQMKAGKPGPQAAIESARELRLPLLTSSLTTAAAFLPIFLAESMTGEYTAPIFKVVTITLLCSWVIALTLVPSLCAAFLRPAGGAQSFDTPIYQHYRRILVALVRHPWMTMGVTVAALFAAIAAASYVPSLFFPPNDRASFTVDIELPEGTPIERTDAVAALFDQFFIEQLHGATREENPVRNWATFIGQGAPRFMLSYSPEQSSPNYALLLANVHDYRDVGPPVFSRIEAFAAARFPDVNVTVRPLPQGAPAWPPVAIRISGRDTERLFEIADRVRARLDQTPGARQVNDNWGPRSKKVVVRIDDVRARRAGLSHQDIAISMQTYLSGLATTDYREGDRVIPVVLRSRAEQRLDPMRVATMNVYSQATGKAVPLSQVADAEVVWEPGRVERRNRLRTVTVEALLAPGFSAADVNSEIQTWLESDAQGWPFGFAWQFGGEAETSGKANTSILDKLPIAGLIIVFLLVAQFNSLRRPLIVLLTIPLSLIGVIFGLLVARSTFGFMTLLGIISLAGIVINNAIVLLDRIRFEIDELGRTPSEAVISAAQQRLRPILLTTATTVGGLLPLWLGGGEMWEPMAVSIIFGLIFATVLTLGIVPVLYTVLFRVRHPALVEPG